MVQQYSQTKANMMATFASTMVAILVAVPVALYVANKLIQSQLASASSYSQVANVGSPAPFAPAGSGCSDVSGKDAAAAAGATHAGGLAWGGSTSVNQHQVENNTTNNTSNNTNTEYNALVGKFTGVLNNGSDNTGNYVYSEDNDDFDVDVDIEDSFQDNDTTNITESFQDNTDNSVDQTAVGVLAGNVNL